MRRVILLVLSFVMVTCIGSQFISTDAAEAEPGYKVSVWYPGWGTQGSSDYDSVSANASKINQVNPYWYAFKADGTVGRYEWAEDQKLVSLAREKNIPLVPLVSNEFDPARVHAMLADAKTRGAHAAALTDLVVSKGYDGLDLDYESLYAADREKFSLFIEDLALRLHAEGKKLTVAVHPKTSEPGSWDGPQAQDWSRIGRAADELKVMIYDNHWNGSEAGPAAPPAWIDQVLTFAEKQVDPAKIRMGLPFYGRDWVGTKARDLVQHEVQALISQHNATVQRDSSREPFFKYRDAAGTEHTVYFQDPESLAAKLDVLALRHPNLGGISIWHVGGESSSYWTTVGDKLLERRPTATTLALGAGPSVLGYGAATTLYGRLASSDGSPLAGKQVVLEQRPVGGSVFSPFASLITDTNGGFSRGGLVPPRGTEYRARFTGAPSLAPSTVTRSVGVKALVFQGTSTSNLKLGRSRTIQGSVLPAHAGYVELTIGRNGAAVVRRNLALAGSRYSFSYKPRSVGTYSITTKFSGDADHLANTSAPRSFRVVR